MRVLALDLPVISQWQWSLASSRDAGLRFRGRGHEVEGAKKPKGLLEHGRSDPIGQQVGEASAGTMGRVVTA